MELKTTYFEILKIGASSKCEKMKELFFHRGSNKFEEFVSDQKKIDWLFSEIFYQTMIRLGFEIRFAVFKDKLLVNFN